MVAAYFDFGNVAVTDAQFATYWDSIDGITDIRGYGMMGGIDIHMDERPGKAGYECFKSLFASGLSLKATGDCLIVAPPFISEKKHIDEIIEKLRTGITNYFKSK